MFSIHGPPLSIFGKRVRSPLQFNLASFYAVFKWKLCNCDYLSSHVFHPYDLLEQGFETRTSGFETHPSTIEQSHIISKIVVYISIKIFRVTIEGQKLLNYAFCNRKMTRLNKRSA